MSFSGDVKEELCRQRSSARHCQIAELSAMILLCGSICISARNEFQIRLRTESDSMAKKFFALVKRLFRADVEIQIRKKKGRQGMLYTLLVPEHRQAVMILQAVRLLNSGGELEEEIPLLHNPVLKKICCRRAFLRGAFLAAGSISDPNSSYHFEIVCDSEYNAEQLRELIRSLDVDAKTVKRKKYHVVYVKEGMQIVELLASMEARLALLEMENVRIVREMRGSVNRKVNCETANINKTVNAAVRQVEDIRYIQDTVGLNILPDNLDEIARIRLQYPEASLKELGQLLHPPVGKSGVNHRLRKLGELAEKLRMERGEEKENG
ncbi:MAG: DNA-binding protein WhiA [Lachnospiraceae bacterium]|nr:DNA-binding protein WhiA [Lachnospiraceae bacterium]